MKAKRTALHIRRTVRFSDRLFFENILHTAHNVTRLNIIKLFQLLSHLPRKYGSVIAVIEKSRGDISRYSQI